MYFATMKSLAHVVEAKDPTTRGHLDRTAHYGLTLAARVDPELAAQPEVGYGFFLHDIGKVGIPESILCKAGPLTELEWVVMRSHPNQGARIVEPYRSWAKRSNRPEPSRAVRRRWLPRGLQGERSRSPRGSSRSRTLRRDDERSTVSLGTLDGCRALRGGSRAGVSGTQFDPQCVDAFEVLVGDDEGFVIKDRRLHANIRRKLIQGPTRGRVARLPAPMTAPAELIHVVRNGLVESVHSSDVAVSDADGTLRVFAGDPDRILFGRSCEKPLQGAISLSGQ